MRGRLGVPLAALLLWTVTACSGGEGGDTTCSEWLALDPEPSEMVLGGDPLSDEQRDILTKALRDERLSTDEMNVMTAAVQVLEYCGADDTGTRQHPDEPIAAIFADE